MYFNFMHVRSKTTFTMSMFTTNQVFLNREYEIVQKVFILKLEPDLDPEPKKALRTRGLVNDADVANI